MHHDRKHNRLVYSLTVIVVIVLGGVLVGAALLRAPAPRPSTLAEQVADEAQPAQPEPPTSVERAVLNPLTTRTTIPTAQSEPNPTTTAASLPEEAHSLGAAGATWPTPRQEPGRNPTATAIPPTPEVATPIPASATPLPPEPTPPQELTYVFPVRGTCQYGPDHHDYPATDIFCPVGSEFVAPTSGTVNFVNRVDRWNPETNIPADRGGIMLAIIGDDGVRYYGSHLQDIVPHLEPGVRVATGQLLGTVGTSGNARNTPPHLHFGISRPTTPDDWETRRGEVAPYPYLQAWERGEMLTPVLPAPQPAQPTPQPPPPTQPVVTDRLAQELQPLFDQTGGTFGGIVYDISTQSIVYSHNADLVFASASLIKIPIVMTVYHLANQGVVSLDEQIVLQANVIVGGSGSIQYSAPGTVYSVRELCARMIYDSDNTAANMLIDHIGGFAPVNQVMAQAGAGQTLLQRRMMDMQARAAGIDNLTSPADMFLLVQTLHDGTLLGSAASQEIIGFMQQTANRQKIPAYLPPDAVVAHKVGSLTGVEHDVGIVWLPDGRPYVVVLMSTALPSNAVGVTTLAEASRIIYAYEQQLPGSAPPH
jgi:beta-lactamase class A